MTTCAMCGKDPCGNPSFCRACARDEKARRAAKKRKTNSGAKPQTPQTPPPNIVELRAAAGDLISDQNILARLGSDVESAGLVGETDNAKILYLSLTSRLFERPVSIAIKGVSAGGKSFTVEQVLKFFPSAAYFVRTGMSERAIIYSDEDYRHRIIVIFEAVGMNSDIMSYLIRTLLSEGRVVYEVVEKTKLGLRPRRIEKEGPTGLITTTTAPKLHPENETRLLSLGVVDTPDQTKAVMKALAAGNAAKANTVKYPQWHALQTWLATGDREVAIPFADELAGLIPPVAVRLRRDFKLLLTLVRAHALLHRETRDRDHQGRIVAIVDDYRTVRTLVEKLFSEGIEATVPPTVRETVTAVGACVGGGVGEVSLTSLARKMKLDKNSAHHRVRKAIERGYLVNREEKRGMPARIAIADPLPEEIEILPTADVLGGRWSVGASTEGYKREDTEEDKSRSNEKGPDSPPSLLPLNQHSNTPTPTPAGTAAPCSSPDDNGQDAPPRQVCGYCGQPADAQPLREVHGAWLHRRCETRYLSTPPGLPPNIMAILRGEAEPMPIALPLAKVSITEIRLPAIASGPDDDLADIDLGWRQ
jgi:hypothetical protein